MQCWNEFLYFFQVPISVSLVQCGSSTWHSSTPVCGIADGQNIKLFAPELWCSPSICTEYTVILVGYPLVSSVQDKHAVEEVKWRYWHGWSEMYIVHFLAHYCRVVLWQACIGWIILSVFPFLGSNGKLQYCLKCQTTCSETFYTYLIRCSSLGYSGRFYYLLLVSMLQGQSLSVVTVWKTAVVVACWMKLDLSGHNTHTHTFSLEHWATHRQ